MLLLALPLALLVAKRDAWLATLDRPEAQARWDTFREAMREQADGRGPVQRKVPKSAEPPLRIWLRDHVWLAIAAWLVLGGTLALFTMLFVAGALETRPAAVSAAEQQTRRDGHDEEQDQRDGADAEQGGHDGAFTQRE